MDISLIGFMYDPLVVLLALLALFGAGVRLVRRLYHFPTPSFLLGLIDNPMRRRIQSPKNVADRIVLHPGLNVVEVGPGVGAFTVEAAERVAPDGYVLAFDISPESITKLRARIIKGGANNIAPFVASAYNLPLKAQSADRVFMVTVLAEIPDRQKALREFKRVLKPDGLLSISEFLLDPDYPLRRTVVAWCREAGLKEFSRHGNLLEYTLGFSNQSA